MGVFLGRYIKSFNPNSLPHMRGGVSGLIGGYAQQQQSSPHAWGCFHRQVMSHLKNLVFPTCVGVFLLRHLVEPQSSRLPHMRGGVSVAMDNWIGEGGSSPHAWGCFCSNG